MGKAGGWILGSFVGLRFHVFSSSDIVQENHESAGRDPVCQKVKAG